jgi:hypothetical protein
MMSFLLWFTRAEANTLTAPRAGLVAFTAYLPVDNLWEAARAIVLWEGRLRGNWVFVDGGKGHWYVQVDHITAIGPSSSCWCLCLPSRQEAWESHAAPLLRGARRPPAGPPVPLEMR